MVVILSAAGTVGPCIIKYCKANKLRLIKYLGKVEINEALKDMFSFSNKVLVENLLTNQEEIYLMSGKRAMCYGYVLLDVRKIG
jgi:calcineurin-like phosphoesterase